MKKRQIDFYFLTLVIILLSFGLVMVFSASSESSRVLQGDAYFFIKRQAIWAVVGLVVMIIMSKIPYDKWKSLSKIAMVVAFALLILVLVIGKNTNGGKRWISLGAMQFQPSEVAKIAIIIFLAAIIEKNQKILPQFVRGLLPLLLLVGAVAGLILFEPHMSAAMVIVMVSCIMLICGGAKIKHFLLMGLAAMPALAAMIIMAPYRLKRVTTFLDPFKDKLGDGWQIIQSLYAIGSGGLFGLGLGRSRQKFLYIPEPHNDFIFSILCEELGLLGALVVILLFALLIYRGIRIAMRAPDVFSCLLATGIMCLIAVQVIINIAVVTSSMPVTGMPLPFFSYGGTTLLINLASMGIMLNISRYGEK